MEKVIEKYLDMDISLDKSLITENNDGTVSFSLESVFNQLPDDFMFRCSQKEVQAIIDCIHDGIYITDGEGNTLMMNKAEGEYESEYVEANIKLPEDFLGKNVAQIVEEGYWDRSTCLEVLKSGKPESHIQHVNGKSVLCTGMPYFEKGRIARVVATDRNISELEKLQNTLNAAEHKMNKYEAKSEFESKVRGVNAERLIYRSEKMKALVDIVQRVAERSVTVLICGESGCGKELIADMLVNNSDRKKAPFIKVNCSALPETLIESELFGYEKGAFTGADPKGRMGLFEAAEGGTILLDEIGELPLSMQSKLLRVLQEREVTRIGGSRSTSVDVRVIAATNVNLKQKVEEGLFREDLYYRLNIVPIEVPPLRERVSDIEVLVRYFFDMFNKKYRADISLDEDAMEPFCLYEWPGNVRELKNLIERLIVTYDDESIISRSIVKKEIYHGSMLIGHNVTGRSLKEQMDNIEKEILMEALRKTGSGNGVARMLKIDKSTVSKKFKKYGIHPE